MRPRARLQRVAEAAWMSLSFLGTPSRKYTPPRRGPQRRNRSPVAVLGPVQRRPRRAALHVVDAPAGVFIVLIGILGLDGLPGLGRIRDRVDRNLPHVPLFDQG